MTTFDERERGFEAKFAHDQDVTFRLIARRDKLFAEWAAGELGLSGPSRAELMQSVLHVTDGPGHDERLLALVAARFADAGQFPLDAHLAAALARCDVEAMAHVADRPDPGAAA